MAEKKIYLSALDREVSVPSCVYFQDDGYVQDLGEHFYFLNWKYHGQFPKNPYPMDETVHGLMAKFGSEHTRLVFHICYLKNSNFEVRGHEETHFLHAVKRLNPLAEAIKVRQGVEVDFNAIRESIDEKKRKLEIIAELGGIFAQADKIGLESIHRYYASSLPRSRYFEEAWFIYLNARNKSLEKSRGLSP